MRWLCSTGLLALCMLVGRAIDAKESPVGQLDGEPIEAGTPVEVPAGSRKTLVLSGGVHVALRAGASAIVSPTQWYPPEQGTKSIRGSRLYLRSGEITVALPFDATK